VVRSNVQALDGGVAAVDGSAGEFETKAVWERESDFKFEI
jgi:hypothetical protein